MDQDTEFSRKVNLFFLNNHLKPNCNINNNSSIQNLFAFDREYIREEIEKTYRQVQLTRPSSLISNEAKFLKALVFVAKNSNASMRTRALKAISDVVEIDSSILANVCLQ